MSIFQFLRIFWARWLVIVISCFSAALGAVVVAQLVQPRYQAEARIMLNFSKPDPVGGTPDGNNLEAWFDDQRQLIRGERVGGSVVDKLGWLSDPQLISEYQGRPASDTRDFRRWLAQRVNERTEVGVGGGILTIRYAAPSALETKVAAEELRESYLRESLLERQAYARKYAARFNAQAETAKRATEDAEIAKASYEKETGLTLTDGGGDADSARLAALASQVGAVGMGGAGAASSGNGSSAGVELAQAEAEIAEVSQTLGPNHPRMLELLKRRQQLQALVRRQEVPDLTGGAAAAVSRAYQQQRSKVLGDRDKVERLRQLQSQVELRRDEYRRTAAKAAELTLEASLADTGSSPLGVVLQPDKPIFPNKKLMVGGATALGLGLGLALALLLELLNRRVRGVEDLDLDDSVYCIGVVAQPDSPKSSLVHRWARKLMGRSPLGMPA